MIVRPMFATGWMLLAGCSVLADPRDGLRFADENTMLARSPANGAFTGLQPLLTWEMVGADRYEIELSSDCDSPAPSSCSFASSIRGETRATSWRPPPLEIDSEPRGRRYAWHVRPCDASGCGSWSTARYLDAGRQRTDLDGDGSADIVVGDNDLVHVFHRVAGEWQPYPIRALAAAHPQQFGSVLVYANDVDADGRSDLAIGPRLQWQRDMRDPSSGVWVDAPREAGPQFGQNAITSCDVDGDGFSDLFVGANDDVEQYSEAGRVYVYRGQAGGALGPPFSLDTPFPAERGFFGGAPKFQGLGCIDLDGDGYSDLIVGARGEGPQGSVYIFRGTPGFPETEPPLRILGTVDAQKLGSVITTGDYDGDGFGDVLMFGLSATVIYGERSLPRLPRLVRSLDSVLTAATSADFNGDGFDDVAYVVTIMGVTSLDLHFGAASGLGDVSSLGNPPPTVRVGAIGDVDGNGSSELAAAWADLSSPHVDVLSFVADGDWEVQSITPTNPAGQFGQSVAGL